MSNSFSTNVALAAGGGGGEAGVAPTLSPLVPPIPTFPYGLAVAPTAPTSPQQPQVFPRGPPFDSPPVTHPFGALTLSSPAACSQGRRRLSVSLPRPFDPTAGGEEGGPRHRPSERASEGHALTSGSGANGRPGPGGEGAAPPPQQPPSRLFVVQVAPPACTPGELMYLYEE